MAKDVKSEPKPDEDVEIVLDDADLVVKGRDDDEIVVAPQEDKPEITGEPPPKAIEPEEGIEVLKGKLAASESARLSEEARRIEAEQRANSAGREVQDTQLTMVTNAIDTVKTEIDHMEADYAQALADSDFALAAKINRAMQENVGKLQVLEGGKLSLEEQAKRPPPKVEQDIVEQFAQQCLQAGSVRSAAWIRAHPDYARDPRLNRKMIAAHNMAEANDIAPDSDAYFDFVEGSLGLRNGREARIERTDEPAVSGASEQVGSRTAAPPAAPVGRGTNGGGSDNPNTVRLTPAQRETAALSGLTEREYAIELMRARKNGEIQ